MTFWVFAGIRRSSSNDYCHVRFSLEEFNKISSWSIIWFIVSSTIWIYFVICYCCVRFLKYTTMNKCVRLCMWTCSLIHSKLITTIAPNICLIVESERILFPSQNIDTRRWVISNGCVWVSVSTNFCVFTDFMRISRPTFMPVRISCVMMDAFCICLCSISITLTMNDGFDDSCLISTWNPIQVAEIHTHECGMKNNLNFISI